jgi:hypothetical protein
MILLLSGEGPSDIGSCRQAAEECTGDNFQAGPMTLLIDQLVTPVWNYSPWEVSAFVFLPETMLARRSKQVKHMVLPGTKGKKETAGFFKHARALAQMAKERTLHNSPVGAVLFHDSDGTNSSGISLWLDKRDAIIRGFEAEDFALGVAMVPKPKSESWLLCSVQPNPYTNCARFEAISGNDNSPNSAKQQFEAACNARGWQPQDIGQQIENGTIQAAQIVMPSFDCFRQQLEAVVRKMMGLPDL